MKRFEDKLKNLVSKIATTRWANIALSIVGILASTVLVMLVTALILMTMVLGISFGMSFWGSYILAATIVGAIYFYGTMKTIKNP